MSDARHVNGPRALIYAQPRIKRVKRADGSILMMSEEPLAASLPSVTAWLRKWAAVEPDHPLIAARNSGGGWDYCSYGRARAAADAIGQALLDRGLSAHRPLAVLSGNSIDHLLVVLGALRVGVPVVPVSVAYSLQSRDHARITMIDDLVRPGAVYVEDAAEFSTAVSAMHSGLLVLSATGGPCEHTITTLAATAPTAAVSRAAAGVTRDTVAKILFTSGSTGIPKGVITTHGMLTCNQQMIAQAWPFLTQERPVLVDWLPWSHTFGGSHNINMVLAHGGTLYVDDGRPVSGLFERTLANYREISPTLSFNVPAGYAQLAPALEQDPALAERFFARLRLVFNAAAALPSGLRTRLERLARNTTGRDIPVTSSWGTTETAPAATSAHYNYADARCIGVPLPGVELKLIPSDADAYEIRVRGPLVSPGYHRRPDLNLGSFDDEGYYRPGDSVSFASPKDPNAGLLFRGRMAEDFKLSTGTFVRAGAVRAALLSAAPVLADAVIAGENRDKVCALAWLNPAETSAMLGALPDPEGEVLHNEPLAAYLGSALARANAGAGSAARIERLIVMAHPANLDAGEITDKGNINQRAVLANRTELVKALYTATPSPTTITPQRGRES